MVRTRTVSDRFRSPNFGSWWKISRHFTGAWMPPRLWYESLIFFCWAAIGFPFVWVNKGWKENEKDFRCFLSHFRCWYLTPTYLVATLCWSFSRENGHPKCSFKLITISTAQLHSTNWAMEKKKSPSIRPSWLVGIVGILTNDLVKILLMEEIRRSPVEVGSLPRYLQGFIHPLVVEDLFHQQYTIRALWSFFFHWLYCFFIEIRPSIVFFRPKKGQHLRFAIFGVVVLEPGATPMSHVIRLELQQVFLKSSGFHHIVWSQKITTGRFQNRANKLVR